MNRPVIITDSRTSAFSLVELLITIAIIGVLAAVAVPIYNRNVQNARRTEADTALGTIRTSLRVYYAENGSYPLVNPAGAVVGASWNDIRTGELTGKYFNDSSYTYQSRDGVSYQIICARGTVMDRDRILDQNGTFSNL